MILGTGKQRKTCVEVAGRHLDTGSFGFEADLCIFLSMDSTFRRFVGGHAADSNRICDMSNRSLFYDKLPFLVSVKTDIQAVVFTALDM